MFDNLAMPTCIYTCLTEFRETEEPVVDNEKNNITEKQPEEEDAAAAGKDAVDASKDAAENEPEEKEPEAKVNSPFETFFYLGISYKWNSAII